MKKKLTVLRNHIWEERPFEEEPTKVTTNLIGQRHQAQIA